LDEGIWIEEIWMKAFGLMLVVNLDRQHDTEAQAEERETRLREERETRLREERETRLREERSCAMSK